MEIKIPVMYSLWLCECTCVPVNVETRSQCQVSSSPSPLCFETGSFTKPRALCFSQTGKPVNSRDRSLPPAHTLQSQGLGLLPHATMRFFVDAGNWTQALNGSMSSTSLPKPFPQTWSNYSLWFGTWIDLLRLSFCIFKYLCCIVSDLILFLPNIS